jgi:hypothetical protein
VSDTTARVQAEISPNAHAIAQRMGHVPCLQPFPKAFESAGQCAGSVPTRSAKSRVLGKESFALGQCLQIAQSPTRQK